MGTSARKRAMDLLARREHSRTELIRKLETRGIPLDEATEAVGTLEGEGLVDDERFAESFVASRIRRGQGPARIGHELAQRGVSRDVSAGALTDPDEVWVERAIDVLLRRYGNRPADDYGERAKRMRFLYQRGFTSDQARRAVAADN